MHRIKRYAHFLWNFPTNSYQPFCCSICLALVPIKYYSSRRESILSLYKPFAPALYCIMKYCLSEQAMLITDTNSLAHDVNFKRKIQPRNKFSWTPRWCQRTRLDLKYLIFAPPSKSDRWNLRNLQKTENLSCGAHKFLTTLSLLDLPRRYTLVKYCLSEQAISLALVV